MRHAINDINIFVSEIGLIEIIFQKLRRNRQFFKSRDQTEKYPKESWYHSIN